MLTNQCFKCKEPFCLNCKGDYYKLMRIKEAMQAKAMLMQRCKMGDQSPEGAVARLVQLENRIKQLTA